MSSALQPKREKKEGYGERDLVIGSYLRRRQWQSAKTSLLLTCRSVLRIRPQQKSFAPIWRCRPSDSTDQGNRGLLIVVGEGDHVYVSGDDGAVIVDCVDLLLAHKGNVGPTFSMFSMVSASIKLAVRPWVSTMPRAFLSFIMRWVWFLKLVVRNSSRPP